MKDCPFCGSKGEITVTHYPCKCVRKGKPIPEDAEIIKEVPRGSRTFVYYYPIAYYAHCSNKSCIGRNHKMFPNKEYAIKAWNRRAYVREEC